MRAKSIHGYFYFGTCVRYLQDATEGIGIHGDGYLIDNIRSLFGSLDELDLQVTSRAAYDLDILKQELEATQDGALLTKDQADRLKSTVSNLRPPLCL